MSSFNSTFILSALLCLCMTDAMSQRYMNQEWSSITALPVNLEWSSSMIASSGHLMTVGNTYTSGESTNLLLVKQATDGSIVWEVEYNNPDNLEDYGIAITEDANGDFYVTGTSYRSATSSLEAMVIKYNAAGQVQWEYSFSGIANGDDIPAAVVTDGTHVAITGTTEGSTSQADMLIIHLNVDGTHNWTNTFDHNNLDDVGQSVTIDPGNGDVTVTGGSADLVNQYDMTTVKYNAAGSFLSEFRSNYNVGIDQPTSYGFDSNGNTIVGGYYFTNPADVQLSLMSLNSSLGLNWNVLVNPTANIDKIQDLYVTSSGDIYVTGHSENATDEFHAYTSKFDANGNQIWSETFQVANGDAFGHKITMDNDGFLNVGGLSIDDTLDTNMLLLQYDQAGNLKSSQVFASPGAEDLSNLLAGPSGSVYLSGTTTENGNGYVTVKYSAFDRPQNHVSNSTYGVDYVDNEIIIRFKSDVVLSTAANNRGKTFGELSDFVNEDAINALNSLYSGAHNFGRMNAVKAYRRFTPEHQTSITRTGDVIDVPDFWAIFILMSPATLDEIQLAEDIEGLQDYVKFAEVNHVATLNDIPNDPNFVSGNQSGLESTNNPDHDIEMDRAWDIHHGSSSAKVGIFDSGITWSHDDFSEDGTGDFGGSKIDGGWNWANNSALSSSANNDGAGHGTAVAGIVGAIRNNGLGVAGVAGGDASVNNFGTRLYGFRITDGSFQTSINYSNAAEAVAEGAFWDPNADPPGYNLDVINMSFGSAVYDNDMSNLRDAVKFAYDNDVVVVASSGTGNDQTVNYPATFHEPWVIKVGANDSSGTRATQSVFGNALDLVAPGTGDIYATTDHDDDSGYSFNSSGTSFAAPHVSGAASLLISYVNDHWTPNPLAPDDVEALFCKNVSDVGIQGYDQNNGFGRLNVGLTMENMEWPFYWVEHVETTTTSYGALQTGSNVQVTLNEQIGNFSQGNYFADRFQIDIVVSHNIGNATLLDGWIRNGVANSNLLSAVNPVSGWPEAQLISVNATQAHIRGFIYRFNSTAGGITVDEWFPFENGQNARYAYSLHLHDPLATGLEQHTDDKEGKTVLYPNPAGDVQRLVFQAADMVDVRLLDAQGRTLKLVHQGHVEAQTPVQVDVSHLAPGVYFYRISGEKASETLKFIKH